ncbi:hypothetical protein LCGC14_1323490 [marine sediment metagenome]|uniref:Uncharacterized protein n=1 Tax=marine sediment metagenome TaxID=412755 RepID=A0A0F9L4C2_9ZZZZ
MGINWLVGNIMRKRYSNIVSLLAICLVIKSYLVNRANERASVTIREAWNIARFFANVWIGGNSPEFTCSLPKAFYICIKNWGWNAKQIL